MKNQKNLAQRYSSRSAFTMIELVFVIVVLGILASVAITKFAATRTDAEISKGRADVSSIRSAIITERQSRLITGDNSYIGRGTGATELDKDGSLFSGVLTYGITAKDSSGHWHARANVDANTSTVKYKISETDVSFTYTSGDGIFTCSKTTGSAKSKEYCGDLID